LKKDKDEGWELYEDLAEKTIQWDQLPTNLGTVTSSFQKKAFIPQKCP